jgi:hypothetical protein
MPATAGVSKRTAELARSLLGTILGDAVSRRPPLIPYNPVGRRLVRNPQRVWATPLFVTSWLARGGMGRHRLRLASRGHMGLASWFARTRPEGRVTGG